MSVLLWDYSFTRRSRPFRWLASIWTVALTVILCLPGYAGRWNRLSLSALTLHSLWCVVEERPATLKLCGVRAACCSGHERPSGEDGLARPKKSSRRRTPHDGIEETPESCPLLCGYPSGVSYSWIVHQNNNLRYGTLASEARSERGGWGERSNGCNVITVQKAAPAF